MVVIVYVVRRAIVVDVSVDGGDPKSDRFATLQQLLNGHMDPFRFVYGIGLQGSVSLSEIGRVADPCSRLDAARGDMCAWIAADLHIDVVQVDVVIFAIAPEIKFNLLGRASGVAKGGLKYCRSRAVHVDHAVVDAIIRRIGVVGMEMHHMRQREDGEGELHRAARVGGAGRA